MPADEAILCRYFPYFITVGSLTILYICGMFWLIANRRLLPAIVMIGAFILFILWLVGLVVVSMQLWGPNGSVQSNCNLSVFNQNPTGKTLETLAWLQQRNICESSISASRFYLATDNADRSIMATGLCHGAHWGHLPNMGHDHGIPSLCQLLTLIMTTNFDPTCIYDQQHLQF